MDTTNPSIGRLENVSLRSAFPHEAHSFTTWLAENIDALADRIGLQLTVLEREKKVGSFTVDLFCRDSDGDTVIIENQLEISDHDHMGKVLTYMVNLDAKTAIWVTPEVRPEHQRVIDWLNKSAADASFYLVQIEAVRIKDSAIAPLFTLLAQPDVQSKIVGVVNEQTAVTRHELRLDFWKGLLAKSRSITQLFANVSAKRDHWISFGSGRSGVVFQYLILKNGAEIDLNIATDSKERNKAIFDRLKDQQTEIENTTKATLDWRRMDESSSCRIVFVISASEGLNTPDKWPDLQERMIDAMIRFDAAFRPRLARINIPNLTTTAPETEFSPSNIEEGKDQS